MKVCKMIDVRLRVFIPARAVSVPIGPLGTLGPAGFDGDNRGFSFDQGTSRAEIWLDVDNSPDTTAPVTIKRLAFGQSARYDIAKIVDVPGKPFWWKAVRRDPFLQLEASPDAVDTAVVTRDTLSAGGTLEPGPFGLIPNVVARFHLNGVNPLEPLAPAINADLAVVVSATGTSLTSYSISGLHDGFPAYEIYVAQRLVYSFDPVAAGTNPFNLAAQNQIVNVPITALF